MRPRNWQDGWIFGRCPLNSKGDASNKILVLDFGAQYAQLIARRVRECRVYSELVPYDTPLEEIKAAKPAGLILSGGPRSVNDADAPLPDPGIFELGVPVLGICYGVQLMAKLRGGRVARTNLAEYGGTGVTVVDQGPLFAGLPSEMSCWMSHGDSVVEIPAGFCVTAQSKGLPVAAMEDRTARLYGVQFHPEVRHTTYGMDILKNFLYKVCDVAPTWTPVSIIEEAVERIRAQVGGERVVCGLSGGVDSSVAALLTYRAVGDQLTCIFVDHGFMRKNEGEQVENTFRRHFHVPLVHVRAQERFLTRLAGITEPEQKRKIIGEEFIRTFEEESHKLGKAAFLVQGTLYPDVIESGHPRRCEDQVSPQCRGICRKTSISISWSLCGGSSRTRSGWSERNWDCRKTWSGGSRSQDRVLPSASSGRSRRRGCASSGRRTPSCSKRSSRPASTGKCGSRSQSFRPSGAWGSWAMSARMPTPSWCGRSPPTTR